MWENHGKTQLDNLRNENEALKNELEAQQRRIMELQHSTQLAALQSAQLASSRLVMPGMEHSPGLPDPMVAPQVRARWRWRWACCATCTRAGRLLRVCALHRHRHRHRHRHHEPALTTTPPRRPRCPAWA